MHAISVYGSPALFGLLALGVVGLPVPDDMLLVLAGALVGTHRLGAVSAYSAAFLGSVTGITLSYVLGRSAGVGVLRRYGKLIHVAPRHLDVARRWFEHRGKWALLLGYFVPGVRHVTAVIAGTSAVKPLVFARFAYAGALLWSASLMTLGYYVGDQWDAVAGTLHHHQIDALGLVMVVSVLILTVARRRHVRQKGRPR